MRRICSQIGGQLLARGKQTCSQKIYKLSLSIYKLRLSIYKPRLSFYILNLRIENCIRVHKKDIAKK